MIYSLEKKAIYFDFDYYIDNLGLSSSFMLNLRYLYRQIRSGYFIFLNLNSITELSPFMKKVSQYLSQSNIDKVKNLYQQKNKSPWQQGLDQLPSEIKDRFLARGEMLNEIDLARLQLVIVRTYLYKVLVAETLDFIGGLISLT